MADGRHLEKSKNVVLMDIINSLLKTGNKTANINVKNIDIQAMLVWLALPLYDFLRFSIRRR